MIPQRHIIDQSQYRILSFSQSEASIGLSINNIDEESSCLVTTHAARECDRLSAFKSDNIQAYRLSAFKSDKLSLATNV